MASFTKLREIRAVPDLQRTGEGCWLKYNNVKKECRKMYGLWKQAKSVKHSGWVESDYEEAAQQMWEREE